MEVQEGAGTSIEHTALLLLQAIYMTEFEQQVVELVEGGGADVPHGLIIAEGSGVRATRRHGHQSRQRASVYATANAIQPPTASRK